MYPDKIYHMLTNEWTDYDHAKGYEKARQDVMLKDGRILKDCWPNAGFWCVLNKELNPETYNQDIPVGLTAKVRLTQHENY